MSVMFACRLTSWPLTIPCSCTIPLNAHRVFLASALPWISLQQTARTKNGPARAKASIGGVRRRIQQHRRGRSKEVIDLTIEY